MNNDKNASEDLPKLEFEDIDLIAMRAVRGLDDQVDAFNEMPLLYVERVLFHMGEVGTVAWEEVPELLKRLAPWLAPEECISLAGIYMGKGSGFGGVHAS